MCYPGVSGPGRSSRQERLQTSTPAHFRKLPFGLRNRGSWLLCQSKTIWLISISIRRQQIYTLEDNLSRSNTGLAWVESLGAGWLEWGSGPIPSVPESGPRLFHLCLSFSLLSSNQPCLSPHHRPVISTNTNPTISAQDSPHPTAPTARPSLKVSYRPVWKTSPISLSGERINLCSLCGIPDGQIGWREEREGGYSAHQSSLWSHAAFLTLCWVRINTKDKSRPPPPPITEHSLYRFSQQPPSATEQSTEARHICINLCIPISLHFEHLRCLCGVAF